MSPVVISPHVREAGYRGAFTVSAVSHLLLFLFLLLSSELFPRGGTFSGWKRRGRRPERQLREGRVIG